MEPQYNKYWDIINQQVLFLKDISVNLIFRPYTVIVYKTSVKGIQNIAVLFI